MALRSYQERRTKPVADTDSKRDTPHELAVKQLVPRIANKSRNAVKVDRNEFFFFQRKQSGRRCSCFSTESMPSGDCGVCFSTGIVGGYEKYGCETEICDVSRPHIRMLNVEPNYDQSTRPVLFRLVEGALYGRIEFEVQVQSNVHMTDCSMVHSSQSNKRLSRILTQIEYAGQTELFNDASVSRALHFPMFKIVVELTRENSAVSSPLLSHVFIRYRKLNKPRVFADIPRRRRSVILQEFGVSASYEAINLFLADEPRVVNTEDMFINCADGTRWKAIDASENRPAQILTSHDVMARLVYDYESYTKVPS